MKTISAILFAALAIAVSTIQAAEYGLIASSGKDSVFFRSPAKLEFIEGTTTNITGGFTFDPQQASAGVQGTFQVDLRTLKTGIDMRDEHMRERHLNTDKFPFAYFLILSVEGLPSELKGDSLYKLSGTGEFYIRGVKRQIPISVNVKRGATGGGDPIRVQATFTLKLDDFDIPRPKALFLKLAGTIDVEVIFTSFNNLPPSKIGLPDWPERK